MVEESSQEVVHELMQDLEQLKQMLGVLGPTPFVIRTYIRTLFSILEAWAYHAKQKAFKRGSQRGLTFSKNEIQVINERRVSTGTDGERSEKPKLIRTSDNVRVAIRIWSRVHQGERPPLDGELPSQFTAAQAFRNRITHPKVKSDLEVMPDNIDQAIAVLAWLKDVMSWQSRLELAHIDRVESEIKARSAELRAQILATGPVDPFEGTLEELYTAPRLKK